MEHKITLDHLEVQIITVTDLLTGHRITGVIIARVQEVLLQEDQQLGLQAVRREAAALEKVLHQEEDLTINKTEFKYNL